MKLNFAQTFLRFFLQKSFLFRFSILFLSLCAFVCNIYALPGDLDATFGNNGKVVVSNPTDFIKQDRNGKIIVGGTYNFTVSRYNADGSPDTLFGINGTTSANVGVSQTFGIAVQPNRKIISVGFARITTNFDFAVVRYNANGTLDSSFGTNGVVLTQFGSSTSQANAVSIQPDGKIVVAGFGNNDAANGPKILVARYNPNGTLDESFGQSGKVVATIGTQDFPFALTLQTDGKIVVGGYSWMPGEDFSVLRLNTNGSLDQTFGDGGKVTTNFGSSFDRGYALASQDDGKIILAGDCWTGAKYDVCVARYNADGMPDNSFDGDGKIITPLTSGQNETRSLLIQRNGKIVLVGRGYNGTLNQSIIARFNSNASFDNTFGNGGIVKTVFNNTHTYASGGVLQTDGKILVSGYFGLQATSNLTIARYLGDAVIPQTSAKYFDFDGDGKSDISLFRPDNGVWYWINSVNNSVSVVQFGLSNDKISPADYDGDGKTDVSVFRNGVWYIFRSSDSVISIAQFGLSGDIPVSADYDGDGQSDLALYRQGVWYVRNSSNGSYRNEQFGIATDKPVTGDFDGDGKFDLAVYRDGIWYVNGSTAGFFAYQFGLSADKPVAADYDGDGKTDFAVYRNGIWYLQQSLAGFGAIQFGIAPDTPTPADYDGDGKTDIAVYRNGTWYILKSTSGVIITQFGLANDRPAPSAFLPQ